MDVCLITEGLGARTPLHDAGVELTLAVRSTGPLPARHEGAPVIGVDAARGRRFDLAVAGDWRSCAHVFAVPAQRRALWLDAMPYERLEPDDPQRAAALLALDLPLDFLVAGEWMRDALAALRPEARCHVVVPGLEGTEPAPGVDGVVVVPDGDAGKVRAAFSSGATVVAVAVEAIDALVEHRVNGLLVEPGDDRATPRALDLLRADPELLERLRAGAAATVAAWPTPAAAGEAMRDALDAILAEPPPDAATWPVRLMGDAIAQAAIQRESRDAERAALQADRETDAHSRELALAREHALEASGAYRMARRAQAVWRHPAMAPARGMAWALRVLRR